MDSRLELSQVLNAAPDGVVVVDERGRIRFANRQFEVQFGYASAELLDQPVEALLPDSLRDRHVDHRARFAVSPALRPMGAGLELRGRRKDGHEFPVEISLSPIALADGGTRVVAVIRDVTERERQAAIIRHQAALLDLARDAIFERDLAGAITYWNRGAERLYGWRAEEVLGVASHDLLQTEFPDSRLAVERSALERGYWEGDLTHHARDGTVIAVASRWTVQRDADDAPTGYLEINTDVTQQRHAATALASLTEELARSNRELELATTELERSNADLEQFAYVASHDLREPLRMVIAYTQLLSRRYRGKLDDDADEFIAYAVEGAIRMQRLIEALLAYSRVGRLQRPLEPTDAGAVLADVLADLALTIEENGAMVNHGPLPTIMADEIELRQLFQNLVGNAIKYRGDAAPRIAVDAAVDGNDWRFEVRDNGIGIDPDQAERIFLPFQRLHTSAERYPGNGIGLAICKKIIERAGGRIWVESEPGAGCTFSFTFPRLELAGAPIT